MTASNVLAALRQRGVELTVADGRLRYRAPVGVIDDVLRRGAAEHRAELIALLTAPSPDYRSILETLPEEWRDLFEERAGIMEFDGNLPRLQAESLALAEVMAEVRKTGQ